MSAFQVGAGVSIRGVLAPPRSTQSNTSRLARPLGSGRTVSERRNVAADEKGKKGSHSPFCLPAFPPSLSLYSPGLERDRALGGQRNMYLNWGERSPLRWLAQKCHVFPSSPPRPSKEGVEPCFLPSFLPSFLPERKLLLARGHLLTPNPTSHRVSVPPAANLKFPSLSGNFPTWQYQQRPRWEV